MAESSSTRSLTDMNQEAYPRVPTGYPIDNDQVQVPIAFPYLNINPGSNNYSNYNMGHQPSFHGSQAAAAQSIHPSSNRFSASNYKSACHQPADSISCDDDPAPLTNDDLNDSNGDSNNDDEQVKLPSDQPPLIVSIIGSQFCKPYSVDLTITVADNQISGAFKDLLNGNVVFHIKEDELAILHERRFLLDPAGTPLVTVQNKIKSANWRWQAFKGDNHKYLKDLLFSAVQTYSSATTTDDQFPTKLLDVFLATNTNENVCDFTVRGSWLERSCTFYDGDSSRIIAQMQKTKEAVGGSVKLGKGWKDTVMVTVYPNIDFAFIVSLIVILDDIMKFVSL